MLAKGSRRPSHDPHAVHEGGPLSDVLDRSNEELTALIRHHQDVNLCIKRENRIRRAGPVVGDRVDRLPAPDDSLAEHLCRQLRMGRHDSELSELANWIIWNLDPDGYLRDDLSGLGAMAGADAGRLVKALEIVQSLEPTGVGARSLQECLLLQLHAQSDPDPVAVELVERHLKALSEKRYDDLARALRQPVERIMRALAAIQQLEPRPGRPFGAPPAQTVRPDVSIEKNGDEYRVVVRDADLPHVRVSQRSWAAASEEAGEARSYMANRIGAASWLITALERRRHTLEAVVQTVVRRQREFLEQGPARLRPLSLNQVAQEVGVHESTVSRVVSHRYVDTPHGVLPLRAFFSNRLPGDPAGIVSPVAACQRIREIVEAEDPAQPLADDGIARALAAVGIHIARRTVVKYRGSLGIAPSPLRRALRA